MTETEKYNTILLIAVIQAQDTDIATDDLIQLGASVTKLPSVGGFLGRRNATLLIGASRENEEQIMTSLQKNCRQRVEYISIPLESAPLPLPAPTPVTVGGAAVFSLDIEHFEVI